MKNFQNKIILAIGSTILGLFVMTIQAQALTISVSPTSLINKEILPGSTTSYNYLFALTDLTDDMNVKVDSAMPGCNDWLTVSPGKIFLYTKGQKTQDIILTLTVPANNPIMSCKGSINISADRSVPEAGVTNLNSGVNITVDLALTNKTIQDMKVTAVTIQNMTQGQDIILNATVYNQGNVASAITKATMVVTDVNGNKIATLNGEGLEDIDAFANKLTAIKFKNNLTPGQYFGDVELFFNDKSVYKDRVVVNVPAPTIVRSLLSEIFANESMPYFLMVLALTTLATAILVAMILRRRMTVKSTTTAVVLLIPLFGLLGYLGYSLGVSYLQTKDIETRQALYSPTRSSIDLSTTATPQLLGASTERELPDDQKTAVGGLFKVYAQADFKSTVVHLATQNEKLDAVEDLGEWYKVKLAGGFGYIPKISIISASPR